MGVREKTKQTGILIKQPFTSSGVAFTLLFGYEKRPLAIKQKVKYTRVKSNLCSGSDILVYRGDFRGLVVNATP